MIYALALASFVERCARYFKRRFSVDEDTRQTDKRTVLVAFPASRSCYSLGVMLRETASPAKQVTVTSYSQFLTRCAITPTHSSLRRVLTPF